MIIYCPATLFCWFSRRTFYLVIYDVRKIVIKQLVSVNFECEMAGEGRLQAPTWGRVGMRFKQGFTLVI